MSVTPPLLEIRKLCVDVARGAHPALRVVKDVTLTVASGEAVGLVGESGSGKSMTAFSILDLFPSTAVRIGAGQILLNGKDLASMSKAEMRKIRGAEVGMVFQDPTSYLDPLMTVGRQIAEPLLAHGHPRGSSTHARVIELLNLMELPNAARVAGQYPHELSGGMRQRVLIAAALALQPPLLIADEPTTALDVTVQAGILALLTRLRKDLGIGLLLITHDLAVVAETCQRVNVMYAGEIVECGDVRSLFARPQQAYTRRLLASALDPGLKTSA